MASVFDDVEGSSVFDQVEAGSVFDTLDTEEEEKRNSPYLATAARIIPSVIGTGVGGVVGSVLPGVGTTFGMMGGGSLGSTLGEFLAQKIEGRETSVPQLGLAAVLGAVPGVPLAKGLSPLARVGIRAGEGAGMGGIGQGASNIIEDRPLGENLLPALGFGAALGAGGGVIEKSLLSRTARKTADLDNPLAEPSAPPVTPPTPEQAARLAALEAQQLKLKRQLDPMFDIPMSERPFKLTKQQLPEVIKLLRSDTEAAVLHLEKLRLASPDPHRVPVRTAQLGAAIAGVDVPERGFFKSFADSFRTSDPTIRTTNPWVFLAKGLGEESSKTIDKLGVSGSELVKRVRLSADGFENQLSDALYGPNGFLELVDEKFKLTPQERQNLFAAGEGAPAMNARVAAVRDVMQEQQRLAGIRAQGQELMIRDPISNEMVPWEPRQNFMPHFTDYDVVRKDPTRNTRAVAEIQAQLSKEKGRAVSEGEAQDIFNRMRHNSRREYGHLEVARRFSLSDHETDGVKAHVRYMEGFFKRINEAEQFGNKFEIAKNLVAGVGQDTNDNAAQYMARTYFEKATGKLISGEEASPVLGPISAQVRGLQTGTSLSTSVIANSSQSVMTDMVVGHGNLIRGLDAMLTKAGQQFGRQAGATLDQTRRDLSSTTGTGAFAGAVLKYTGFTKVEQYNRMLAANSGRAFVHELVDKLRNGAPNQLDEVKRHLRTMGIEPMEIIARGYNLTLADELKAARSVISRTQFKIRPQDLPLFWSGPWGSLISQFASFGFKAAKAVNDDLVKEARRGNFKPMARLLLVAPIVGEGVRDIQSLVKGTERPDDLIERLADNVAGVGAFAIYEDAFRAASFGELGVSRRVLGPTLSDAAGIVGAVGTGDLKQLGKTAAQKVPVIGSQLRKELFPPEER